MYAHTPISELNIPGLKRTDGSDECYDPRLRNFASGEFIQLDTTPYIEYGCPETNYETDEYKVKPRVYDNYNDIDLGLIMYQTDETVFDPFYGPTLGMVGKSIVKNFKTPSDVYWKESKRQPKFCKYNYMDIPMFNVDSQLFREDITADYMSQLNRHRFLVGTQDVVPFS